MKIRHGSLFLIGALCTLPLVSPAWATRSDRPVVAPQATAGTAPDVATIGNATGIPPLGTVVFSTASCTRPATGVNVTMNVELLEADITKSKASGLSQKQTAYLSVTVSFQVGMDPPTLAGPSYVESCKGKLKLSDGDADGDYDGGADLVSLSTKCGSEVPATLGLDMTQTAQFLEAFGEKPSCKIVGVPTVVP